MNSASEKIKYSLIILGVVSTILLLWGSLGEAKIYMQIPGGLLAFVFTLLLVYYLMKGTPLFDNASNNKSGKIFAVILNFLFLILSVALSMIGQMVIVLYIVIPLFSLFLIIKFRRLLEYKDLFLVLGLTGICFLTFQNRDPLWVGLTCVNVFLAYLAGLAIIRDEKLNLHSNKNFSSVVKAFLFGAVLAIPMGLVNALSLMDDSWITHWYHVLFAIKPAISEEILFRLFLMLLLYRFNRRIGLFSQKKSWIWAILLSSIVFSSVHGFHPLATIYMVIAFSLPLSLLFLKKGLAGSIGNHFVTDLIRYGTYYLVIIIEAPWLLSIN